MKKLVSVIIPNWNGKHLLEDCLNSLKGQTFEYFQTIVVDNGSDDNSVEYITNNFPGIKIVKNKKNLGFARAVNIGVKSYDSKYVVFLNNDTLADKNWLKELVKTAEEYKEVVSVNSKLVNFYNRRSIDGLGIEINEVGQARSIGFQKDPNLFKAPFYIFGATGGASLFKRDLFLKLGMFDEDFFMYCEEVDFAFRATFLGYKSIYCPTALVFHKHKASANKLPQHVEYWQFKNMFQVILKNYPTESLVKTWRWLKIILVYLNTIIYQIKSGFIWPPFATTIWLLFNLPKLIYKRSQIQSNIKIDLDYLESFLIPKKITFWEILR